MKFALTLALLLSLGLIQSATAVEECCATNGVYGSWDTPPHNCQGSGGCYCTWQTRTVTFTVSGCAECDFVTQPPQGVTCGAVVFDHTVTGNRSCPGCYPQDECAPANGQLSNFGPPQGCNKTVCPDCPF